jgi:biopolymer transport protein ExbD
MNFRRGSFREEPEINLVPFIDVLIVIVIFLAVTTTYSAILCRSTCQADANKPLTARQINVGVSATGQYMINRAAVAVTTPEALAAELRRAAGSNTDPVIIINADANTTHQSVINVMEAARVAGFSKITFTTQQQRR